MNKLQEFLLKNDVTDVTEKVCIGGRLEDFEFTVRAIPSKRYREIQQLAVTNFGTKKRSVNTGKLYELIVSDGCVDPNFKDPEFIKASGCPDTSALLNKVLLSGELEKLAAHILKVSGYDTDIDEDMEQVKNS